MRFTAFKEYRGNIDEKNSTAIDLFKDVVKFLSIDLVKTQRELALGLNKLSFNDNFETFQETLTISAGVEAVILNKLTPIIPSKKLIVRGKDGAQNVVDGDTEWTQDFVYLKNVGLTDTVVTVIFLR